jgi:hypothetical protein
VNGIPLLEILKEQFYSKAPATIARPGISILQIIWLLLAGLFGVGYGLFATDADAGASILAANAVFTALSITMAMFFWPRAINIKSDAEFNLLDERHHVYRLTTQLFWTVLVGIVATGLAVVQLVLPSGGVWDVVGTVTSAASVGLTVYQVLLLGQSVFRLYAATIWMPRA